MPRIMPRILTILGLSGVSLLIFGLALAVSTREFVSGSLATEGTILRAGQQSYNAAKDRGGIRHIYVIWFPIQSGRSVVIQREIDGATPYFRRGDLVPVRYDPSAPAHSARIATFGNLWGASVFSGVVGGILVIFAVRLAFGRRHAFPRPG